MYTRQIEKELRELDEEYTNLEKRKAVIEGIGAGTVPVNEVPNPINNRSADNFDQDKEYRSAWLKHVRGLDLTEKDVYKRQAEYRSTKYASLETAATTTAQSLSVFMRATPWQTASRITTKSTAAII